MSLLLTETLVDRAFLFIEPSLKSFLEKGFFRSGKNVVDVLNMHLVVVEPTIRFGDSRVTSLNDFCSEAILWEHSLGDHAEWKTPYHEIARRKAYAAWRYYGMPLQEIQAAAPYLLQPDDTVYPGGVARDGLIVCGSGVKPWQDEMVSALLHAALRGLCIDARDLSQWPLTPDGHFLDSNHY